MSQGVEARRKQLEDRIAAAMRDQVKKQQAEAQKTARLRELRLAKEAAERQTGDAGGPAEKKSGERRRPPRSRG